MPELSTIGKPRKRTEAKTATHKSLAVRCTEPGCGWTGRRRNGRGVLAAPCPRCHANAVQLADVARCRYTETYEGRRYVCIRARGHQRGFFGGHTLQVQIDPDDSDGGGTGGDADPQLSRSDDSNSTVQVDADAVPGQPIRQVTWAGVAAWTITLPTIAYGLFVAGCTLLRWGT